MKKRNRKKKIKRSGIETKRIELPDVHEVETEKILWER